MIISRKTVSFIFMIFVLASYPVGNTTADSTQKNESQISTTSSHIPSTSTDSSASTSKTQPEQSSGAESQYQSSSSINHSTSASSNKTTSANKTNQNNIW